jgi:hypothetical protein
VIHEDDQLDVSTMVLIYWTALLIHETILNQFVSEKVNIDQKINTNMYLMKVDFVV